MFAVCFPVLSVSSAAVQPTCLITHFVVFVVWWYDPRTASPLVTWRTVCRLWPLHEQLWPHGSDHRARRVEDQHGLCGPPEGHRCRGECCYVWGPCVNHLGSCCPEHVLSKIIWPKNCMENVFDQNVSTDVTETLVLLLNANVGINIIRLLFRTLRYKLWIQSYILYSTGVNG